MATLIDVEENPVNELLEENGTQDEELEVGEPVEAQEDEIPEKYRGKDVRDLVRMHQEAQAAIGKQGEEVGQLRKIVDKFITSQLEAPTKAEPETEEEEVDWFADPDEALNKKLESHPAIKQLKENDEKQLKKENISRLKEMHPDYQDILQEGEFAEWIRQSKVRQRLLIEADRDYNVDSADELFSLYKERKGLAKETAETDKEVRKQKVANASNGGASGSTVPRAKKVYRRSDIIDLMVRDPARYEQLASEIKQAYAEGRVK